MLDGIAAYRGDVEASNAEALPRRRVQCFFNTVVAWQQAIYGRIGARKLRMHVVRPRADAGTVRPAILYVHGGGWFEGDKEDDRTSPSRALGISRRTVYARARSRTESLRPAPSTSPS